MELLSTSAGSHITGMKNISLARTNGLVTFIHHDSGPQCGGGDALGSGNKSDTASKVAEFVRKKLNGSIEAANTVEESLNRMGLDKDPERHAQALHTYNREQLGIRDQLVILHDVGTGNMEVRYRPEASWTPSDFQNAVKVACADARHTVPQLDDENLRQLLSYGLARTKGKAQLPQSPKRYLLGGGDPITKEVYNQVFTVNGEEVRNIKMLLQQKSFSVEQAHTLAATILSAFYYNIHSSWPDSASIVYAFH